MLVAFFLAFVWGFAGVFRDKHKPLAVVVTLVSGIIDAYLLCRIFT
ncbi:MAG: hypothetical protein ABFD90_11765 [Phycisphaerales bacterium]